PLRRELGVPPGIVWPRHIDTHDSTPCTTAARPQLGSLGVHTECEPLAARSPAPRAVRLESNGAFADELRLGCPGWHEILLQLEMPCEGLARRKGVTLFLRPKDKHKVHRKAGPVMLVKVKAQIIVDMNLIVPMAEWGWWGGIDHPVGNAQH